MSPDDVINMELAQFGANRLPITIIPIGGMKEVGANCFVVIYNGKAILIDAGVHPERGFSVRQIWDRLSVLKQYPIVVALLTHMHQDHGGAVVVVANLLGVPVYASMMNKEWIKANRHSLSSGKMSPEDLEKLVLPEIIEFKDRETWRIADFEITAFALEHSIPETFCFRIRVAGKTLLHFGDFKLTGYDKGSRRKSLAMLRELAKEPIYLTTMDVVNIGRPGESQPEEEVVNSLLKVILDNPGRRHFIFLFSTNVQRIINLWMRLYLAEVKVFFRGASMHKMLSMLEGAIGQETLRGHKLADLFQPQRSDTAVFFCTGSQAEPNSFMERLAEGRMIDDDMMYFYDEGDHIYSSATMIPVEDRNSRRETIGRMRGHLQKVHSGGCRIFVHTGQAAVLDLREAVEEIHCHESGHGPREDIKQVWKILRSQFILPYHAPVRSLVLARELSAEIKQETGHESIMLEPDNNESVVI